MGKIVVFSGPRGVGKTSIIHGLRDTYGVKPIVPFTTRQPREHEVEGKDYNFVAAREFDAIRRTRGMFDVLDLKGDKYGTPLDIFRNIADDNSSSLESVRTIGLATMTAVSLQRDIGSEAVKTVFVMPASWHDIEYQMREEGMSEEAVLKRRSSEPTDLTMLPQFDQILMNAYGKKDRALGDAINYIWSTVSG